MYRHYLKPLLDRLFAFILLVILTPVWVGVSVILFIELKGSPFFTQARPGYQGKIFYIFKFKTMTDEKNENGELLPDFERLTRIGHIVRKLSLDEVPQLLNVIRGEMSFIGPRPLLVEYLDIYTEEEKRRHDVLPGITGWAQINGRNTISWKEKFTYDLEYVNNLSATFDLNVILKTIKKVMIREGVDASSAQTMDKYNGHN